MRIDEIDYDTHHKKEVGQMLHGDKPLALVTHDAYQMYWKPYIVDKTLVAKKIPILMGKEGIAIAKPSEKHRIEMLRKVYQDAIQNGMTREHHIKIGRLLGYSERDIQEYVKDKV